MFHVKHPVWVDVAEALGRPLNPIQIERLATFRSWLRSEALAAGGIGPAEVERLDQRHISDSLLFASVLDEDPETLIDVGSGVGLPGIPLAVLFPSCRVTLIDRSGRRADLARRAVRVVGVENVMVSQGDVDDFTGAASVLVARASLPAPEMLDVAGRVLVPGGLAVVGGSWKSAPKQPGWETVKIPPDHLDHTVWLLMMRLQ